MSVKTGTRAGKEQCNNADYAMKIFAILCLIVTGAFAMGQDCCKKQMSQEEAFMLEAKKMMMAAEGKQPCCQSTAEKVVEKGAKGCCNEKGQPAKFQVMVVGKGYKYFGCEGSAKQGRKDLIAKGPKVGKVEKAKAKVSMK